NLLLILGFYFSNHLLPFISGRNVATSFIRAFLRNVFPLVPEEWIVKIGQHLLSPAQLAFTSGCLGLKDLVSYTDTPLSPGQITTPPSTEVMSNVILAVIGVLAEQNLIADGPGGIAMFCTTNYEIRSSVTFNRCTGELLTNDWST
ncbi:hypothetical protein EG68_12646, partial [Paragonimus skrjabini miyazakii]